MRLLISSPQYWNDRLFLKIPVDLFRLKFEQNKFSITSFVYLLLLTLILIYPALIDYYQE
jgi:hypothetical protein